MRYPEGLYSIKGGKFEALNLPEIQEKRGKDYVYYGEANLFPQKLIELYDNSAMHHTAIQAIKDGIIGDGVKLIGDEVINSKGETVDEVLEKVALDYSIYQGYSLNLIWNKEGSRIAEMYHLPFANVRSGKMDEKMKSMITSTHQIGLMLEKTNQLLIKHLMYLIIKRIMHLKSSITTTTLQVMITTHYLLMLVRLTIYHLTVEFLDSTMQTFLMV